MIEFLVNIFAWFGAKLNGFIFACLWIGWAITSFTIGFFHFLNSLVNQILLAASILAEDFTYFLEDVGEVIETVLFGIYSLSTDGIQWIIYMLMNLGPVIKSIPMAAYNAVSSIKIGHLLIRFVILLGNSFLLIGLCIWKTVEFLFQASNLILIIWPSLAYVFLIRKIDELAIFLVQTREDHWFKSACGIALGVAIYKVLKYCKVVDENTVKILLRYIVRQTRLKVEYFSRIVLMQGYVVCRKICSAIVAVWDFIFSCWTAASRELVGRTSTVAGLQIILEREQAANLCIICMEKRRDVMLFKCRHMLMCKQCALIIADDHGFCPACRTPIDNIINVYT